MFLAFWRWLYVLSKRKYKMSYLDVHKSDIKCPNCKEWASIIEIDEGWSFTEKPSDSSVYLFKCKRCYVASEWDYSAPVPLLLWPQKALTSTSGAPPPPLSWPQGTPAATSDSLANDPNACPSCECEPCDCDG